MTHQELDSVVADYIRGEVEGGRVDENALWTTSAELYHYLQTTSERLEVTIYVENRGTIRSDTFAGAAQTLLGIVNTSNLDAAST